MRCADPVSTLLTSGRFDFIDFGCSKGGSIEFARKALGGTNGFGIDLSKAKVDEATRNGFEAVCADVRELAAHERSVKFVTMLDFLEHLPSLSDARSCIASAALVASDFIFIRQPWFDSDGYLLSLGLKLYWSHWTGHPNAMSSLEFHNALSSTPRISNYRIYGRGLIKDSEDACVHPLSSPGDQHAWESERHPAKPHIRFKQPVYRQIMCIAALDGGSVSLNEVEKKVPFDETIFDSRAAG